MAIRVKLIGLMGSYLILTSILALVLWAAVISEPIIRQAEANFGGVLTCQAAYEHREINNYFYPTRALQADTLYLFSLLSPFFLLGFGIVLVAIALYKRLKRLRWMLVSVGVLLCVGLFFYMPVIGLVSCGVE